MGYSKEHVERTRKRILEYAGRLFREKGYDGVGIDSIMEAAGLTRGGFYAHFKSKRELFDAVVGETFDFTNQIKKLAEQSGPANDNRMLFAIETYLNPALQERIGKACTMASGSVDIARGGDKASKHFSVSFEELVSECGALAAKDEIYAGRNDIIAAISLAVGGLLLARACDDVYAEEISTACKKQLRLMIR